MTFFMVPMGLLPSVPHPVSDIQAYGTSSVQRYNKKCTITRTPVKKGGSGVRQGHDKVCVILRLSFGYPSVIYRLSFEEDRRLRVQSEKRKRKMQKNAIFFAKDLVVSSKSSTFAPAFEKVRAFSSVSGAMTIF